MKKCESCGEIFKEFDNIVFVNEQDYFHKSCVVLVPAEYAVFAKLKGGGFLGMCSDDDLACPFLMLEEGDYLKEGEEEE